MQKQTNQKRQKLCTSIAASIQKMCCIYASRTLKCKCTFLGDMNMDTHIHTPQTSLPVHKQIICLDSAFLDALNYYYTMKGI